MWSDCLLAQTSSLVTWSLTLLSSCPNQLLNTLQKVQNSAARLVFKTWRQEHIKPLLQKLHWLPVESRIQYKISTLCYNFCFETYSPYLSELLTVLLSIQTTSLYPRHENLLCSSHKNKNVWRMSLFFYRPDTIELVELFLCCCFFCLIGLLNYISLYESLPQP